MSWFIQETPLVKKYKKYRKIGQDLNNQVREIGLKNEAFEEATHLLGIRKGRTIILADEDDIAPVMDFALNDCRWQGKNAVERYQEEVGGKTAIERELLAGMLSAYTSLFRIESVRTAARTLTFTDLLAAESDPVTIIDIGLSETAAPGFLMFFRLVPLADFNMSAGAAFIFPADRERYLLRQHKVIMRKVKSADTAVQRYVAFFKLNQRLGLGMGYQ
jgi:hypothetical protein